MASIQNIQVEKRGGKRRGAGRKGLSHWIEKDPRYLEARGVSPLYAAAILSHVVDERRIWERILNSPDDNVVLRAMTFLMAMRDGKPSQQINVTSKSITISATDVASARAIAAELVSAISPVRSPDAAIPKLGMAADPSVSADAINADDNKEKANIMVSGDQGADSVVCGEVK